MSDINQSTNNLTALFETNPKVGMDGCSGHGEPRCRLYTEERMHEGSTEPILHILEPPPFDP